MKDVGFEIDPHFDFQISIILNVFSTSRFFETAGKSEDDTYCDISMIKKVYEFLINIHSISIMTVLL